MEKHDHNDHIKTRFMKFRETCRDTAVSLHEAQSPHTVVVTCSDSRISPELLLDAGLGELFVIRTAGAVLSDYDIASIEYAVMNLAVKHVMIIGHSRCGAVEAARSSERSSRHIETLKAAIRPVIERASKDTPCDEITKELVKHTKEYLREESEVIDENVSISCWFYDMEHCELERV